MSVRQTCILLISALIMVLQERTWAVGEPYGTAAFSKYVHLTHSDAISPRSFPPFVVQRIYQSQSAAAGVFGRGWICWPFDVEARAKKIGQRDTVSISMPDGSEEVFVAIEGNVFAPLDAARLDTLSLLKNADGFVRLDLIQGRMVFDSGGRLIKVSDPRGQSLEIARSKDGLPTAVTVFSPSKAVFSITCDNARKRLTEIKGPNGRAWRYKYDTQGNLAEVADDRGQTIAYRYQGNRLARIEDSRKNVVAYGYDAQGRLTETDWNGRKETRAYDAPTSSPDDWRVTISDPIGRKSEYQFLASKRREVVREKDGNAVVRQYDDNWRLKHVSSARDGVVSYAYDDQGRPVGIVDARNQLTQIRYDNALGLPSAVIDDRGQIRKFQYDATGRIISARDSDGQEASIRYDRFGLPLQVSDPMFGETRFRYGPGGALEAVENEKMGRIEATTASVRGSFRVSQTSRVSKSARVQTALAPNRRARWSRIGERESCRTIANPPNGGWEELGLQL